LARTPVQSLGGLRLQKIGNTFNTDLASIHINSKKRFEGTRTMSKPRGDHKLTIFIASAIIAAILLATALPMLPSIAVSELDAVAALKAEGIDSPTEDQITQKSNELMSTNAQWIITPLKLGGEVFLRVLKMLVVPLVVSSVMSGILGMGDVRKLGKPGGMAILYYVSTTILAVLVGLIVVNLISPGVIEVDGKRVKLELTEEQKAEHVHDLAEKKEAGEEQPSIGRVLKNLVLMLFTDNLFKAAVNMELLPMIVFSIVFAGLLTTMGDKVTLITSFILQLNEVLMKFVLLVMNLAPIGIFCLVAGRFGEATTSGTFYAELQKTGAYTLTVILGLGVHAFVTLPAILYVFTKRNPYRFMAQMSQALLTAFSTASSSATLPVTIESATDEAGVSRKSVDFVLPLGATINMDGTALYEAVAAIFIAQGLGIELSMMQQMTIAVTATLAAIGAAGIPEAGLVTMVIVLTSVGLPTEYIATILAVDWFLDRFRTTVNVFGDACGAAVVEKTFPEEHLIAEAAVES